LPNDCARGISRAVALFNLQHFYDAHEILETQCWQVLPRSPEKLFFQGLIQLCAAFVHWQNANHYGYHKKCQQAFHKLSGVWLLYNKPCYLATINVVALLEELETLQQQPTMPVKPIILMQN
jgi:predicted metal-dependent hydrolase